MPPKDQTVYTISRLNREVRVLLEAGLPTLWVEGELSRVTRASSGHIYFRLKDDQAAIDCAMWRSSARRMRYAPVEGRQVLVRGRVGLYEAQGRYQLIVEHMEAAGEGRLRQQLEALRARLEAEGLFSADRKRPLPALPRRIGVVTSPSGAALRDVLQVLRRRFPATPVRVYPTPVQGEGAAAAVAAQIGLAGERLDCDVLIVTRGGGSLEDLWSFNEEAVVRAVATCPIPVVSAVGHEIDVTLSDLVADVRAPTPSAAAELVVPDRDELLRHLDTHQRRLNGGVRGRLRSDARQVSGLDRRLRAQHPGHRLRQQGQRLDELELRMHRQLSGRLSLSRERLVRLGRALAAHHPGRTLPALRSRLARAGQDLVRRLGDQLAKRQQRLKASARQLNAVSPLATLGRGYAIVQDSSGSILRDAGRVAPGDPLRVRLASGRLVTEVREVEPD